MFSMVYEPGNRAYYVTADDARAGPCVFAWILFIWSSLTMIARVYARRQKWTWSDWCSLIAYVVGLAHFSLLLTGLADGLATSSRSTVHDKDVALVSRLR
ncbi:hypothetical protein WHR41_09475 [Cladosporium halotolerans]|uniref:Uncharacterized protein n=1 Tax=Cladosporium halotolerans TaxID=1052096 RepID=A0AB34KDE7_9PEZI